MKNPTNTHKLELLNCKESCYEEDNDYEGSMPSLKQKCLLECINGIHVFDFVSPMCNTCLTKFVICVVSHCDQECLSDLQHTMECEDCTKQNKCSIGACTNPNYVPEKVHMEMGAW